MRDLKYLNLDGLDDLSRVKPARIRAMFWKGFGLVVAGASIALTLTTLVGCAAPAPVYESRFPRQDEGIKLNDRWMQCAANFAATQAEKCKPRCGREDYALVVNAVANYCGGSEVQESGGYLLSKIWEETMRQTDQH